MTVHAEKNALLAEQFDHHRKHLRAVAYHMLGCLSEADDAVQGTWLRLSRSDHASIDNLGGWLTTAVARECLDMLRSRGSRREVPLEPHIPDPIVSDDDRLDPERQALIADSVGLALLIVLDTMAPAERIAFVLHDVFALPYDEIARLVGRSPAATRQLASRARRRVKGSTAVPDPDVERQRRVVEAFLAAARAGDFGALLRVLDPDVVVRAETGTMPVGMAEEVRGAEAVAKRALAFAKRLGPLARPALVNGAAGVVAVSSGGELLSIMGLTVSRGRIVEIDILTDPERLRRLETPFDARGFRLSRPERRESCRGARRQR